MLIETKIPIYGELQCEATSIFDIKIMWAEISGNVVLDHKENPKVTDFKAHGIIQKGHTLEGEEIGRFDLMKMMRPESYLVGVIKEALIGEYKGGSNEFSQSK